MERPADNFFNSKKEELDMAVFSKPCNFAFEVSESKADAFLNKDTRTAFKKAMAQFQKHGGTVKVKK